MSLGTSALRRPLEALVPRRPGSIRRTMHVDAGTRHGWSAPLQISGVARDVRTGPPGATEVLGQASIDALFDPGRALVQLDTHPSPSWAASLLGAQAGGGFRRRLGEIVPPEQRGSLLHQVLDDVPAAVLISGYGFMRLAHRQGFEPQALTPPNLLDRMAGLCSGWRPQGTAMRSVSAGRGVPLQDCPPAPPPHPEAPVDPWAFHQCPPLAADAMRRRRCLDLSPQDDGALSVSVWATFRDSVGEPQGGESVLHEYTLRATVADGVVSSIEADPRVLPFGECPAAADNVGVLVGVALGDMAAVVPEMIKGIDCCTHLNDLLRAVGGLAGLAAQLAV